MAQPFKFFRRSRTAPAVAKTLRPWSDPKSTISGWTLARGRRKNRQRDGQPRANLYKYYTACKLIEAQDAARRKARQEVQNGE
jgi:hypothetical protein